MDSSVARRRRSASFLCCGPSALWTALLLLLMSADRAQAGQWMELTIANGSPETLWVQGSLQHGWWYECDGDDLWSILEPVRPCRAVEVHPPDFELAEGELRTVRTTSSLLFGVEGRLVVLRRQPDALGQPQWLLIARMHFACPIFAQNQFQLEILPGRNTSVSGPDWHPHGPLGRLSMAFTRLTHH